MSCPGKDIRLTAPRPPLLSTAHGAKEMMMKALSIRQPWVWAILNAGKDIENRDWKTTNPACHFRGRFLIHASSGMTRAEYDDGFASIRMCKRGPCEARLPLMEDLPRGGIVGVATVVAMVESSSSPWFYGPLGLVLENVKSLPFIPCKGALGFFNVPADIIAEIEHLDRASS